ncbi:MAG: glycerol-3-phosphate 1-O-acyltransferase PlsY [Christensenellales bacterium]|jgi:glycerol-3-phosphate acyltransferase PlsY
MTEPIQLLPAIACAVSGYLIGCLSFAYIFSMLLHKRDIRKYGSGNAGTTNVARTFGVGMGVLTFACDVGKGVAAVWLGGVIMGETGGMIGGLFAVLGHNWPVFLNFRGGKGVATSFGVIMMLAPMIGLGLFGAAVIIIGTTRIVSIASICGLVLFPIGIAIFYPDNVLLLITGIILAVLTVVGHRENIKRIIAGNERRLSFGKKQGAKQN